MRAWLPEPARDWLIPLRLVTWTIQVDRHSCNWCRCHEIFSMLAMLGNLNQPYKLEMIGGMRQKNLHDEHGPASARNSPSVAPYHMTYWIIFWTPRKHVFSKKWQSKALNFAENARMCKNNRLWSACTSRCSRSCRSLWKASFLIG